ncbi:fatty acid desaturase [Dietzia psychralcaliphila]|uniref:fatty acid desaturase n=1 Tax=Dietzia psychralcaliphila TaxID=139021 RepID=UPI000D2FC8F3|nr:fatty acid desaturase [Dietzia psychralcaliphila]PTM87888.1 ferredoxin-NADP reductase [Dietzia psychralcaliphila]
MTLASDISTRTGSEGSRPGDSGRGSAGPAGPTGLAEAIQALYARAKAEVGQEDLTHIRNVTAYGQAIDARRRELLREGGPRAIRRATALEMMYRLMQFSELGHNIVHGSYDHLPDNGEYHSDRYDWDFNVDTGHWKTMHHAGHHPNTNIVGKDHDLGYSVFRGSAGQDWYGHHLGQVAFISALAAMAPIAAPFFLANIARKVEDRRFFSSYTLRAPARIARRDARRRFVDEPFRSGWKPLSTLVANYLGGVTGYMSVLFLVLIEHHAGELELFTDPGPDETADQYYERQIRATRNFLPSPQMDAALTRILEEEVPFENRPDLRIFYGGLDTHVEHHLFPDLPPSMQRKVAPEVRAIAAEYGLPYHETPLLETVPLIAKTLTGLSVPFGEREFGRPTDLLRNPASLLRRLRYGLSYRALPESPYLNKPRFYNVPVKVVSATPVADGQALSVRLGRPRGWEDVHWDAGAYVSVRVAVDGEELVRQYSLVRDSADSHADAEGDLELCVKRVEGGRVSNRLGDELRAGAYVTLVGTPQSSGDFAIPTPETPSLHIAGGVGITPIISLLRRIGRDACNAGTRANATLLYFNRDDRSIIFESELRELARESGVQLHVFTDAPSARGDLSTGRLGPELLQRVVPDAAERETYVCAPAALIDLTRGWLRDLGQPAERFHAESFTAPELDRPADDGSRYTVRFRRTGTAVEIDGATTLLEAAGRAGIAVPTGCERGLCKACVTGKLSGTTRGEGDGPLQERITVCTSTASSDIELDL